MIRLLFLSFSLLFAFSAISQSDTLNDEELIAIFKEINESDASHMKEPEIREQIFIENFKTIVKITKAQGFPQLQEHYRKKKIRNCIINGSRITFIHILQSQPKMLLNEEMIELFGKEIKSDRLDNSILETALFAFKYDHDVGRIDNQWDEEIQQQFNLALEAWDIDINDSPYSKAN